MALPARLLRPRADSRAEFPHNPRNLVLVFDTSLEPANLTVSVPVQGSSPNCTIDWGDGTSETHTTTGFKTHTYAEGGVYIVQISGTMRTLNFGTGASSTNNKLKLVRCLSFGEIGLTSLIQAFQNCVNLIQCPSSLPRESSVTTLASAFNGCSLFNDARISRWDTSTVTACNGAFSSASNFNVNISGWDTRSVTNMSEMFRGVANVRMDFNQPIGLWDTSNVTTMSLMFSTTNGAFSQDISGWDIRKVTSMSFMFAGSAWGTANYDAALTAWADLADDDLKSQAITAFATLSAGTQTRVTSNGHGMVAGSRVNISGTTNYDGDYNVLAAAANTFDIAKAFVANDATGTMKHRRSRNVTFSAGSNKYSAGTATTKRGVLTGTYSWTITDGGQL